MGSIVGSIAAACPKAKVRTGPNHRRVPASTVAAQTGTTTRRTHEYRKQREVNRRSRSEVTRRGDAVSVAHWYFGDLDSARGGFRGQVGKLSQQKRQAKPETSRDSAIHGRHGRSLRRSCPPQNAGNYKSAEAQRQNAKPTIAEPIRKRDPRATVFRLTVERSRNGGQIRRISSQQPRRSSPAAEKPSAAGSQAASCRSSAWKRRPLPGQRQTAVRWCRRASWKRSEGERGQPVFTQTAGGFRPQRRAPSSRCSRGRRI